MPSDSRGERAGEDGVIKWTDKLDSKLKAFAERGMTSNQIATKLGFTRMAIRARVRIIGVRLESKGGNEKRLDRDMIASLWAEGKTAAEIAARVGSTKQGIHAFSVKNRDICPKRALPVVTVAAKPKEKLDVVPGHGCAGHPQTVGVPMTLLRANQCRYEVADAPRGATYLFCGAPSDGTWCEAHRKIVYQGKTASTLPSVKEAA